MKKKKIIIRTAREIVEEKSIAKKEIDSKINFYGSAKDWPVDGWKTEIGM